jgi:hypothetical protein
MMDSNIGAIDYSKNFPDYLSWLFTAPISQYLFVLPILMGTIFCFLGAIFVFLLYIRIKKAITERYTYLEVRPTDRTLKSPLSTNELYTLFHSLGKQNSVIERIIGFKRKLTFELVSTKQLGIRYILRIPDKDKSVIKKTLLAYLPGVEIKETTDYLDDHLTSFPIGIKEISLKSSYVYPLQSQASLNQYDPIAYVTAHMTKLLENELVSLQFICSPIQENTYPRITHHNREISELFMGNTDISHKIGNGLNLSVVNLLYNAINLISRLFLVLILSPFTLIDWFLDKDNHASLLAWWVFDGGNNKRLNEIGLPKQQLYQTIQDKISQPLFDVTIRFISQTKDQENNKRRLSGLTSSFDTFATPNQSFQVKESSALIFHNKFFDNFFRILLTKRLSILANSSILSVTELSSLYHFPFTTTTQTEDLQKIKSPQLPPPLSLKKTDINFDITFAKNKYGETETAIGQTLEERRRHTYMIGATGTGKTTLLLQMIYQDLGHGKGLAVIDPHGDLSKRLLEIIPKDRIKDVVYFNPYDIEYPIGLNFLELPKDLSPVEREREKDFITSSLISVFHKLYDARYSGPRMEHILRNVILTALELEEPTLFTIYELLTDTKYRKRVVNELTDNVLKTFWKNEFGAAGSYQRAEQISPITNKLGRFLTTTLTRNILNQPKTKLDFNDIMDNKKILLCDLSKGKIGEDNSFFLGSLIIAKLELAAFRRINLLESNRTDFFLYVDEFQNFATTTFAQVLSEARKYRLCAILAHQNTVQLEDDLLDTIIGNSGTIISFRTSSPKDERKILPIFTPQVEEGQIGNLPSYHFYIKINALQPQDSFTGEIDDFTITGSNATKEKAVINSRSLYGTKTGIKQGAPVTFKTKKSIADNENKFEQIRAH